MARKAKATESNATVEFDVRPSEKTEVKRSGRQSEPSPLQGPVLQTITEGPLKIVVPAGNVEMEKAATNALRKAAREITNPDDGGLGVSLTINPETVGDEVYLHFQASTRRANRKYTADDIRAWAVQQGYANEEIYPKIQNHVRDDFKAANGFAKPPAPSADVESAA